MATDDIVTRLRNYDFMRDGDYSELTMNQAADEIERLRTQVRELQSEVQRLEKLANYGQ